MDDATRVYEEKIPTIPDSLIGNIYNRQSVVALVPAMPDSVKKSVRWYIDCGDDDFLYEGNSLVHIAMRKREIPHEFRIRDGGHNWTYWRTALPDVLNSFQWDSINIKSSFQ